MKEVHAAETDNWSMKVEDNFTYLEYHGEIAPEEGENIVEEWMPLISKPEIDTHVLVLDTEGHFDKETFGTIEQAGELGLEHGVERWAVVGRKTKTMAIGSKLPDDIETFESDDVDEALDWARE